jgi:hypothetical protein
MSHAHEQPERSPRDQVAAIFEDAKRLPPEANEATTRVAIIDKVLAVLGWRDRDVARESPSGAGDFLDYLLLANEKPWMVVEAKRAGDTFTITPPPRSGSQRASRTVDGLIQRGGNQLQAVLKQAATYCNDRGIVLACVTNGTQWMFFRGLGVSGRSWTKGSCFVFSSTDEILAQFPDFWACLSREAADEPWLLERLEIPGQALSVPPMRPIDHLEDLARGKAVGDKKRATYETVGDRFFADICCCPSSAIRMSV